MSNISNGINILLADRRYAVLIVISSVVIAVLFAYSMGALFLTPIFFFNYFEFLKDGILNIILNFIYVFIVPVLASISIAASVYKFITIKKTVIREGGTSTLGFVAAAFVSTCSNCVPVALYSLGISYGLFEAFFAPFVLPFKILTIAIITLSFYFATTSLGEFCKLKKTRR